MEVRKIIFNHLERGDAGKIAEKLGMTKPAVWQHITGKVKKTNPDILRAALELIQMRKEVMDQIEKEAREVIPQTFSHENL